MKFMCYFSLRLLLVLVFTTKFSYSGFVQVNNVEFTIDGSRFAFNGFNSFWMMVVAADPTQRHKVSETFQEASAAGLTVCRTWAFSDGVSYMPLQISPGVYNEQVFQGLDFVVSEASKHGIRLILPLVNNWADYGGRPQYCRWAKSAGENIHSDFDFYTNPVIKGYYKNNVNKVITRINTITGVAYKDDPAIMAWQLINEAQCESDLSGNTLIGWYQEMASYVKSIDNNHLVGSGEEGWYGADRKQDNANAFVLGTDFIATSLIKEIDFAQAHVYPESWLPGKDDATKTAFVQAWISKHWNDSVTIIKKPFILGEFGKSNKVPGYTVQVRDSYLTFIYDIIYGAAQKGGFGGGLVWELIGTGMESMDSENGIVLSQNPSTRDVIVRQSNRMAALPKP